MPESNLPSDFNLFRYGDRIAGHFYKGSEKTPGRKPGQKNMGKNLGSKGLRFESKDPRAVELFNRYYGSEFVQGVGDAMVVPAVRVYLPYRELYHNLVVGYGEYNAGGGLQRFCCGQMIRHEREQKTRISNGKPRPGWSINHINEPCPAADDSDPCESCGYIRRLTFYVAELYEHGFKRPFAINAPAVNEIGLFYALQEEERRLQRFAPEANVSYLPNHYTSMPDTSLFIRWILRRSPEMIGVPAQKKTERGYEFTGKQTQREEWLLQLEVDPDWWDVAMSRVGKGQYRLDRETGEAVCVEDERLRYLERMAGAAQALSVAGQGAAPLLSAPLRHALPQSAAEPLDLGQGIHLDGRQPIPVYVEEVLDGVPFRQSSNDPTNSNRLMAVASLLPGTTTEDIKTAIADLYKGRKSDELTEVHLRQVIDRLMVMWAIQQADLTMADAQSLLDGASPDQARTSDEKWVTWWKEMIQGFSKPQEPEDGTKPNPKQS